MKTYIDILTWYKNMPADFNDISTLIHARRKLSIYLVEIAQEGQTVTEQYYLYNANRKIEYYKEYLKASGTIKECESIAYSKIEDLRKNESEFEGQMRGTNILIQTIKEVLNAMSSHIKNLEHEKMNVNRTEQ